MGRLLRFPKRARVEEADQFVNWLRYGLERNWVSDPTCSTHDGVPMTDSEESEWEDGYDPCIPVLRVWIPE